jgi:hypothetical protein
MFERQKLPLCAKMNIPGLRQKVEDVCT